MTKIVDRKPYTQFSKQIFFVAISNYSSVKNSSVHTLGMFHGVSFLGGGLAHCTNVLFNVVHGFGL